ncbi:2-succinyl-6-hydroxy-2,4-cyclohexadiene-1-carboxylate synthase [Staphylococcus lutrae]|uniref:Putative 2-succinyl-6-hydroxy-2,4-cyclohexadiene-1-carboxylate synthase n=1 Tax=Staphylococcus lutrae TaxID=155085 RepID=A0AAC9WJN5_9STAP|nr:2-succinyl-6-hydroxy-2,4-cyclohexadiene-1-carboxylate synthase [Staphylococcus lutrae]ARJ51480.1 2-succinyl-6-hydroxy-2,4-cyclohexadiene-1-carboxylate synthase [Staphylococcus lutrae]PNZ38669.1 2-succinyl-6-hydroxy-2,4-cyclohexadiene-1-carboxylate synthase [Staphylococcus lutrae]
MLHYNWYEAQKDTKDVLVLLHGFISDQRVFDAHIQPLSKEAHVLCIDLPGHGQDDTSLEITWDFDFIVAQLHQVFSLFPSYTIYLHGYSMGARVALYYALKHPDFLAGLILESGSPGIQDERARIERQQVDAARARVLELANIEVFVNDWEQLPLFQTQRFLPDAQRQDIRQLRLAQHPQRLAKALRDYGTGHMPNLWPELSRLKCPVQLIVGEWDEKFVHIAREMVNHLTQVDLSVVAQVGHTINVEDAAKFDTILLAFIKA